MENLKKFQSQITFLYVKKFESATSFFEDILGFNLVIDAGWTKIYRSAGNAFIGVVTGEKAFKQPQDENAVLVTLCVNDVPGWYEVLKSKGVKILGELEERSDIGIRHFF